MAYIGSAPTSVVSRQSSKVYRYTATAGQTVFSGADASNQILDVTPSDTKVHINGLLLEPSDYTLTSSSVTLTTAAAAGDELTVTGFQTFEVADTYDKATADTRYVNASGDTMTGGLNVTGTVTADGLSVSGLATLDDYSGNSGRGRISIGNAGQQYIEGYDTGNAGSGSYLSFGQGTSERLRIDNSGSVGIGTTSPSTNNGAVTKLVELQSTNNNSITGTTNTAGYSGLLIEARLDGRSPQPRYAQIGMSSDSNSNGSIDFSTAASGGYVLESMKIDDNGRVTKARQPMMHGRSPRPGGGGYLTANTNIYVNDLQVNVGNAWNNSTGTWTCPVAGKYMVYANLLIDQSAGTTDLCYAVFRHNGGEFVRGYDNSRTHTSGSGRYDGMMTFSGIRNCAANDTLDLRVIQGFIHWGGESSFGIYLLA